MPLPVRFRQERYLKIEALQSSPLEQAAPHKEDEECRAFRGQFEEGEEHSLPCPAIS